MTLTHDVTGRPLPLEELGDDWLHAMGPHLPRLTLAVQQCWKNTGMLAAVANCGRSRKWCCKEDWDLNAGAAAMWRLFGTTGLRQRRTTDFYFLF